MGENPSCLPCLPFFSRKQPRPASSSLGLKAGLHAQDRREAACETRCSSSLVGVDNGRPGAAALLPRSQSSISVRALGPVAGRVAQLKLTVSSGPANSEGCSSGTQQPSRKSPSQRRSSDNGSTSASERATGPLPVTVQAAHVAPLVRVDCEPTSSGPAHPLPPVHDALHPLARSFRRANSASASLRKTSLLSRTQLPFDRPASGTGSRLQYQLTAGPSRGPSGFGLPRGVSFPSMPGGGSNNSSFTLGPGAAVEGGSCQLTSLQQIAVALTRDSHALAAAAGASGAVSLTGVSGAGTAGTDLLSSIVSESCGFSGVGAGGAGAAPAAAPSSLAWSSEMSRSVLLGGSGFLPASANGASTAGGGGGGAMPSMLNLDTGHVSSSAVEALRHKLMCEQRQGLGGRPIEVDNLEKVGAGSFGVVYRGVWQGAHVAIKYLLSCSDQQLAASATEALLAKLLAHPNVVQTFACKVVELTPDWFADPHPDPIASSVFGPLDSGELPCALLPGPSHRPPQHQNGHGHGHGHAHYGRGHAPAHAHDGLPGHAHGNGNGHGRGHHHRHERTHTHGQIGHRGHGGYDPGGGDPDPIRELGRIGDGPPGRGDAGAPGLTPGGSGTGGGADAAGALLGPEAEAGLTDGAALDSFHSGDGFGVPYLGADGEGAAGEQECGPSSGAPLAAQYGALLREIRARPHDVMTQIIMEYCDRGSLQRAIDRRLFAASPRWNARVALRALLRTAREVAQGMCHLHASQIVHGDLKPANVLLKSSRADRRGFVAKVGDFGLSRLLTAAERSHLECDADGTGTLAYMAPEVLNGSVCPAADVYSFGVLLWELVTGERPFADVHPGRMWVGVCSGALRLEWPPDVHPMLRKLGDACLATDKKLRPSFTRVARALGVIETIVRNEGAAAAAAAVTPAAAAAAAAARANSRSSVQDVGGNGLGPSTAFAGAAASGFQGLLPSAKPTAPVPPGFAAPGVLTPILDVFPSAAALSAAAASVDRGYTPVGSGASVRGASGTHAPLLSASRQQLLQEHHAQQQLLLLHAQSPPQNQSPPQCQWPSQPPPHSLTYGLQLPAAPLSQHSPRFLPPQHPHLPNPAGTLSRASLGGLHSPGYGVGPGSADGAGLAAGAGVLLRTGPPAAAGGPLGGRMFLSPSHGSLQGLWDSGSTAPGTPRGATPSAPGTAATPGAAAPVSLQQPHPMLAMLASPSAAGTATTNTTLAHATVQHSGLRLSSSASSFGFGATGGASGCSIGPGGFGATGGGGGASGSSIGAGGAGGAGSGLSGMGGLGAHFGSGSTGYLMSAAAAGHPLAWGPGCAQMAQGQVAGPVMPQAPHMSPPGPPQVPLQVPFPPAVNPPPEMHIYAYYHHQYQRYQQSVVAALVQQQQQALGQALLQHQAIAQQQQEEQQAAVAAGQQAFPTHPACPSPGTGPSAAPEALVATPVPEDGGGGEVDFAPAPQPASLPTPTLAPTAAWAAAAAGGGTPTASSGASLEAALQQRVLSDIGPPGDGEGQCDCVCVARGPGGSSAAEDTEAYQSPMQAQTQTLGQTCTESQAQGQPQGQTQGPVQIQAQGQMQMQPQQAPPPAQQLQPQGRATERARSRSMARGLIGQAIPEGEEEGA